MDFDKITLLPEELRTLRHLRKGISIVYNKDAHSLLLNSALIKIIGQNNNQGKQPTNTAQIGISRQGRRYLRFHREDMFRHRWPVYLSIAAIIISITSALVPFVCH